MALLELKNINKFYGQGDERFYALKDINIEIKKGEMVAIMGPSGAGKTTLLHIIGGIDAFNEGDYIVNGVSVKNLKDSKLAELRNKVFGFVFQYFALLKDYTAIENVRIPLNYRKMSSKEKQERAIKYLNYVGLDNHKTKLPKKMSGGQQQRVAIARALAQESDILLADEPTGALDQKTSEEIMILLKKINEEGKTIILVTHDEKIASFCNRKISIKDGTIESDIYT